MNRKGLTTKELKQLKSKFDKLKTYPEKITFWEENVLPYTDYETHILVPPNIPDSEIDNLHHNPKNVLSIEPKDANERGEYLKWKERIIQQKLSELNLLKVEIEQQKKVDANAAKTLAKYYENGVWINPIGIDSKQYEKLKKNPLAANKYFVDAVRFFTEKSEALNDKTALTQLVIQEIQRTENAINNTYLKNLHLLDSEKMKEYEGGVMYLNYLKGLPEAEVEVNAPNNKLDKDKLTHKQQVLLLNQLGFFDLPFFDLLNETQKGVLVAHIVNKDEKNSEDNVRYVRGKRANKETQKIFSKDNIKKVNALLENVGISDYKVPLS